MVRHKPSATRLLYGERGHSPATHIVVTQMRASRLSPAPDLVIRVSPLDRRRAILSIGPLAIRASLGRSGLSAFKREGDGATPIATMAVLSGYWRADRGRRPACRLPMQPIGDHLLWCDAPRHPLYNRPSRLGLTASHERMARADSLYDICMVLDFNIRRRARGLGSAIFFHLARDGYQPTEGCIAISRRDMERVLACLRPGSRIIVKP